MSGANNLEKIISYFAGNNSKGISVKNEAIAGILASVEGESGFNPFRNEGNVHVSADDEGQNHGYGLFQFTPRTKITTVLRSDDRTKDIFNDYYKAEYGDHAVGESDNWKVDEVPDSANDAFLEVEMDYAVDSEFSTTTLGQYRNVGGSMGLDYLDSSLSIIDGLQQANDERDAARIFVWIYERPKDKSGAASAREDRATDYYLPLVENFLSSGGASSGGSSSTGSTGNSSSTSTDPNAGVDGSNVTIIGDSITNRSKNDILELMPQAYIDAQDSKQFTGTSDNASNPHGKQILTELIDSNSLRSTLVFALGTNSSAITKDQVQEIVDLAGEQKTVVFLTNYSTGTPDFTSNNNVFQEIKNTNNNVVIGDWSSAISAHTDWMDDNVHPKIGDGTKLFAQTIQTAVKSSQTSKKSDDECCDKKLSSGTITKAEIDGYTYAFPIAGATQENYMNPGNQNYLSPLPCNDMTYGVCHHKRDDRPAETDLFAVDLGVDMEMLTGTKSTAETVGDTAAAFDEYYYKSSGATVVAVTSGTIVREGSYTASNVPTDWYDKCGKMSLQGDDGNLYWIGHLDLNAAKVHEGDHVEAGDEISKVGAPQCAQSTQAHVHLDIYNGSNNTKPNIWIVELMNQLWEALPGSGSGSGATTTSVTCPTKKDGLNENGMTLEEAKEFMANYRTLMEANQGKSTFSVTTVSGETDTFEAFCKDNNDGVPNAMKNCVSFSWYFLRKYVDHDVPSPIGFGYEVAKNLGAAGYETGSEPKVYSIFSKGSSSPGHTGVVLGVQDDGTIVVGESSCGANYKDEWAARAAEYSPSDYSGWTFAYAGEYMKL